LIVLPAVSPMVASLATGAEYATKPPVPRGIDASYLLTPSYANPLFGPIVESRYAERTYRAAGFVCYLGLVPVLLAALGAWRAPRRALGWLALFALAVILSVGVDPSWNNTRLEADFLPFGLLRGIPLLENLRVANRFMLVAGLGLAVLVGIGWQQLRYKRRWALPLATILVLAEYSWLPYPIRRVELSPLLQQVAQRPGAVLDIPFHQRSRTVHNMLAQTVHGKPISGGYLSTYPPATLAAVDSEPALSAVAGGASAEAVVDIGRLRELGFQTVIVHKYRSQGVQQRLRETSDPSDALEWKRILRLGGIRTHGNGLAVVEHRFLGATQIHHVKQFLVNTVAPHETLGTEQGFIDLDLGMVLHTDHGADILDILDELALGGFIDAGSNVITTDGDHILGAQWAIARVLIAIDQCVAVTLVFYEQPIGITKDVGVVRGNLPAAQLNKVIAGLADAALVDGATQSLDLFPGLGFYNNVKH
ncbi:MAG: hypothetical protein MI673_04600, partial [Thiotrichales bacterium]|nr:hypothetical protein [Thiotrichales bacterium]